MSGDIFDDWTAEKIVVMCATSILWVEASDTVTYPTMLRTATHNKELSKERQ